MPISRPAALAAWIAGIIGLAAATPPAFAQQFEPAHYSRGAEHQGPVPAHGRFAPRENGELLALACSAEAATRLESRIDRTAGRLELTPEQSPLFEEFRTAALTAQTRFADTCGAVTDNRPQDLIDAIRTRRAVLGARLEAVEVVLPALEALYDSLTDAQKFELVGMRGETGRFSPRH